MPQVAEATWGTRGLSRHNDKQAANITLTRERVLKKAAQRRLSILYVLTLLVQFCFLRFGRRWKPGLNGGKKKQKLKTAHRRNGRHARRANCTTPTVLTSFTPPCGSPPHGRSRAARAWRCSGRSTARLSAVSSRRWRGSSSRTSSRPPYKAGWSASPSRTSSRP